MPSAWPDSRFEELGLSPPPRRQKLPIPAQDVAGALDVALEKTPEHLALVGRHARLTYAALEAEANAAAAYLRSLGVRAGDRVAATAANHTDLAVAFLAVQRLGAIWVGINRNYAPPEKRFMLADSGAKIYLTNPETVAALTQLEPGVDTQLIPLAPGSDACAWRAGVAAHAGAQRPAADIDPWAPAAIAYTSGTTGFPKGVVHSQHSVALAAHVSLLRSKGYEPGVVIGTALPMSILNLMTLGPVAAWLAGATHVSMDRIDAEGVAEWLQAEPITHLALVPSIVQDLLTNPNISPDSLARIRHLVAGAAVVPEGLPALYAARFGKPMTVGYGLTESPTGVCSANADTPAVQGAIGVALPHLEVTIRDETNREVDRGVAGEICFRATLEGPLAHCYSGPLGYWGKPEATTKLLNGGWVHTGDVGHMDENGQVFIHDRRNDLIIRGGANIYPAEVERVLRMDARVRDCAIVGRKDVRLGETVVAFVEPFAGAEQDALVADLKALCAAQIAAFKTPNEWFVVDALPRNAMGKVLKPALRAQLDAISPISKPTS